MGTMILQHTSQEYKHTDKILFRNEKLNLCYYGMPTRNQKKHKIWKSDILHFNVNFQFYTFGIKIY
jgi:hypothetical protein